MNDLELKLAQDEAIKARRNGASLKDAATLAGVDVSTLYRWRQDARFAMALSQARMRYKMALISLTSTKRPDWLLAKQFPEEFGEKNTNMDEEASKQLYASDEDLAKRIVRFFNPVGQWTTTDNKPNG